LEPGIKGFIVTCNNREREAIRESYDLLNEFADKIYGKEDKEFARSGGDIDDAAKNELESLEKPRRFQVVESGVNNCLFIRTQVEDPAKLVYAILDDIEQKAIQRTKFLLRMLPVSITCKAYLADIIKATDTLITDFFAKEGNKYPTYAITFKHRNNNQMKREQLFPELIKLFESKELPISADLKNPSVVFNVEVICSICCLSLMKDYYKYKRYNLLEYALKVKSDKSSVTESITVEADCEKKFQDVKPEEIDVKSEVDSEEKDVKSDVVINDGEEVKVEKKGENDSDAESVIKTEEADLGGMEGDKKSKEVVKDEQV